MTAANGSEFVRVPVELVKFLLGEAELDGEWFLDSSSDRPRYWWRDNLRECLAAPPAESQPQGVEAVATDAKLPWSEKERAVILALMHEHGFSYYSVMRQCLRLYQHDQRLRANGETCVWSGDAQRARDFAGAAPAVQIAAPGDVGVASRLDGMVEVVTQMERWVKNKDNAQPVTIARWLAALQAIGLPAMVADAARLDALQSMAWTVSPFDMPTGQGDRDIGWRVIEHRMIGDVVVSEHGYDDLRAAIDAAREASRG